MVTDADGLAWLRALEKELGEKTIPPNLPAPKFRLSWTFTAPTKAVPDPGKTRDALGHLIALVENRLRDPP